MGSSPELGKTEARPARSRLWVRLFPAGEGGLSRDCASDPRPLHPSLNLYTHLSDPCTLVCLRGSPTRTRTSLSCSLLFRKTSGRPSLTRLPRGPAEWTWSAPGMHGLHRASGQNDRLHTYGCHAGHLSAPSFMWAWLSVGSGPGRGPSSRPAPARRSA